MDQSKIYEKYLDRLRGRRAESPYYTQARREIRQLAPAYSDIRRTYEQRLRRQDLPEEVAMQYSIEQQKGWAEQLGGVYSKARTAEEQRREQIVAKEEEVEFKRDIALEQEAEEEKRRKKAAKRSIWKTLGTVVGGIAGAVLALPTGGMSLALGAGLGAQLGGGVGSIVGAGEASGWAMKNMEIEDIGALETGVGQIFSGIGSLAQTQRQLKMTEGAQQIMSDMQAGLITPKEAERYMQSLGLGAGYQGVNQGEVGQETRFRSQAAYYSSSPPRYESKPIYEE